MSDWAGLWVVLAFFFRPADPPHSVLGHGLGNRAAKLRHGTAVFFVFASFSSCRRPPQPRAGGAARVIWLLTLWHRTVCFCFILFIMHVILYSLCYAFSARHFPPRGTVGCATFPFRVGFRLFVSPPVTMAACGRVLATLVSLVIAPAFSFNSPFFVSPPPPATLTVRGKFFYCGLIYPSAFFVSPPRHAGGTREVFDGVLPYCSAFRSTTFLRVFPGFMAKPFRGLGLGFEEPHLRLVF